MTGSEPHSGESRRDELEKVPLGQRLLDNPFLLLVACIVVMFLFYTGWGLIELARLDAAPLP